MKSIQGSLPVIKTCFFDKNSWSLIRAKKFLYDHGLKTDEAIGPGGVYTFEQNSMISGAIVENHRIAEGVIFTFMYPPAKISRLLQRRYARNKNSNWE